MNSPRLIHEGPNINLFAWFPMTFGGKRANIIILIYIPKSFHALSSYRNDTTSEYLKLNPQYILEC